MKRKSITFVVGGVRSGKSSFALRLAEKNFRRPLFIATAEAFDSEMADRITRHRKERSKHWKCIEEPLDIAKAISAPADCDGILLDCLTVWLGNIVTKESDKDFIRRKKALLKALQSTKKDIIIVANEVGLGVVPESELGRKFRDLAGWLNQDIAKIADTVFSVTVGIPLKIKG